MAETDPSALFGKTVSVVAPVDSQGVLARHTGRLLSEIDDPTGVVTMARIFHAEDTSGSAIDHPTVVTVDLAHPLESAFQPTLLAPTDVSLVSGRDPEPKRKKK
jgi:hypothetical protein